jgi:hypothetical protein
MPDPKLPDPKPLPDLCLSLNPDDWLLLNPELEP